MRGSSKNYYLKFFGENFGRDDQYIEAPRRRLRRVQGDRLPGPDAAQPVVQRDHAAVQHAAARCSRAPPAPIRRRRTRRPGTRSTTGSSATPTGGNIEVSARSPFFFRADYNEVQTTGTRPGSGQLGTGLGQWPDRVRHPGRIQDEERALRGRLHGEDVERQARLPRQQVQQQHRHACSGRTSTCAARWTPRCCRRTTSSRSGASTATARELPLDSTFLLRATRRAS